MSGHWSNPTGERLLWEWEHGLYTHCAAMRQWLSNGRWRQLVGEGHARAIRAGRGA